MGSVRCTTAGHTRIELPTFRDAAGRSRAAIMLPEEARGLIGDAMLGQYRALFAARPALPSF